MEQIFSKYTIHNRLLAFVLCLVFFFTSSVDASVFGVVYSSFNKRVITSSGEQFEVSVTYGSEVPVGTQLSVQEIGEMSPVYDLYRKQVEETIEGAVVDVGLLDIKLLYHGEE